MCSFTHADFAISVRAAPRTRSTRSREASQLYRHRLVLVRPDQHVAWRGDAEPGDTLDLVDLVRGAARTLMAKSA